MLGRHRGEREPVTRDPVYKLEIRTACFFVVGTAAAISTGMERLADGSWLGLPLLALGVVLAALMVRWLLLPVTKKRRDAG